MLIPQDTYFHVTDTSALTDVSIEDIFGADTVRELGLLATYKR